MTWHIYKKERKLVHFFNSATLTHRTVFQCSSWTDQFRMLRRSFSQILPTHLRINTARELLVYELIRWFAAQLSLINCYYLVATCISVLGLGMASCSCITPNKGSGAPSVSSSRVRTSGRTRDGLENNGKLSARKELLLWDWTWR